MAKVRLGFEQLASLPAVCVCCGQAATRLRSQEFEVNTPTAAAILAASAAFGAPVWSKRGLTLSLPVCEYHRRRGRRSNRTFFRGFALTIVIGVGAHVASFADGPAANYLGIAAMIAFVVTMVAAMSEVNDGLAVRALSADSFTLAGVHPEFARGVD
jgi:hypothetical protein